MVCETGPYLTPTISSSFDPAISTFPSAAALAPGLHRQRQRRECRHRKHVQHRCVQPDPEGPVGIVVWESWRACHRYDRGWVVQTFHLTERMRMRLESTFTNLFNHPNFAPANERNVFVLWRRSECSEREQRNRTASFALSRLSTVGPGLSANCSF
jgi:hypothetical protein